MKIISPNFVCTFEHLSGVTFGNIAVEPPLYKISEQNRNLLLDFLQIFRPKMQRVVIMVTIQIFENFVICRGANAENGLLTG